MGILTPLFLIGLGALALPVVFHLVRRTPRGKQEFSSLMFLAPSPPRLTRRSRLDQILLLLLRLAVLGLLALAFARPFFRESALLSLSDLPRRRVALLIDVSGSMQRPEVWRRAVEQAERELDDLNPHDDVALYAFSDRLETIVAFASERAGGEEAGVAVVRRQLHALQPTWAATDLGAALVAVAGELDAAQDVQQSVAEPRIVLISDFQNGSRIDALQSYEWPERVRLINRAVAPSRPSNATVLLLPADPDSADSAPRVRVVNASDSSYDQFFLRWTTASTRPERDDETAVYVPPGESRVVRLPRPEKSLTADQIALRGDDQDFDNTFHVVPPKPQKIAMLYAGDDAADDPRGLAFYLRVATTGDPLREVELGTAEDDDAAPLATASPVQIVVSSRAPSAERRAELTKFVERGGTLVLVPRDDSAAEALPMFFDDVRFDTSPAGRSAGRFLLLGEIDFTHAWFAPLANPRYSDFTKIHFWKHRSVTLDAEAKTRVVARFDNGDPWMIERAVGRGRVIGLTSGWHPDDSQLAVSSKFVVLIGNLIDQACGGKPVAGNVLVNQSVSLPGQRRGPVVVHGPDGREFIVPAADPTSSSPVSFRETAQPGIYRADLGGDEFRFAVNLPLSESDTAPMATEQLEQLGVRLGTDVTRAERLSRIRQQRDTELEGRQKIWRWLLVGCLGILMVESWWAGRAAQNTRSSKEAAT